MNEADDFDYSEGEVPHDALPPWLREDFPRPLPASTAQGQTDTANAERFLFMHKHRVRFVGTWSKWLVFDGKQWRVDDMRQLQAFAKDVSRMLFDELGEDSPRSQFNFAKKSANAGSIRALLTLAESDVAIHHDELDRNSMLLNVMNGTVDLTSGKLRPHAREDLITKLAPVTFQDAGCPLWLSFLNRIFDGDAELIAYVQQILGYCLTGVVAEHILPVFYGDGANGKSTLIETFAELLGEDYACKASRQLLVAKGGGNEHKTQFADLLGKRFVFSEETAEGERLAEGQVKDLTGGGTIKARRMREDLWQFQPTHKIVLATNHKPEIRGTDEGIWRRVKLIPFNVVIPEDERDGQLKEKLKSELPGILNWCIDGCLSWQALGLNEPDTVKSATSDYRNQSDILGQFIDEHCVVGDACMVQAKRLFEAYRSAGGEANQTRFGLAMTERGFRRERPNHGQHRKKTVYRGIGLISEENEQCP